MKASPLLTFVGMKRLILQMMPENCSTLFPCFRYLEGSGACDGDPCGEDDSSKVCWTSWSPRSGLKAVSQECLMRQLWCQRPQSGSLSKADLRHKHSMWAYNPAYHLKPKKHSSPTASNGTSFLFTPLRG